MRFVLTLILFAAAWLLWSGIYTPLLLALGAASCAMALWLAKRMGFFAADVYTLNLGWRLVRFWLWLIVEITRANVTVARVVLRLGLRVEPSVVTVNASNLPPPLQAILANAITLTPGTVSLDINDGRIRVHCLTKKMADDLRDGEMLRRVRRMMRE